MSRGAVQNTIPCWFPFLNKAVPFSPIYNVFAHQSGSKFYFTVFSSPMSIGPLSTGTIQKSNSS